MLSSNFYCDNCGEETMQVVLNVNVLVAFS